MSNEGSSVFRGWCRPDGERRHRPHAGENHTNYPAYGFVNAIWRFGPRSPDPEKPTHNPRVENRGTLSRIHEEVVRAAQITAEALKERKLMVCGNGGSAADSQHLLAEFVSRLTVDRPALRAVALTTDSSILTAIGNDDSYDNVFERQVEALGRPGDVLLAISTSGNSKNCVKALKLARRWAFIPLATPATTAERW